MPPSTFTNNSPATMNGTTTTNNNDTPGYGWTNGAIPPQPQNALLYPQTLAGRVDLYKENRRWIALHSSWSRIGANQSAVAKRTSNSASGDDLLSDVSPEEEATRVRALMAQLCEAFYRMGWATGTGGGISIRVGDGSEEKPFRVFVAPSGVQKEDLIGDDMFELDMHQNVVQHPKSNPNLRQSACTPLWFVIYRCRPTARAVLHTHSVNAVYATLLDKTERAKSLKLTHLEMIKGVGNHAYDDVYEIPIIDNRPTEDLLADQLEAAVQQYPLANAVLVRRHGLYVWGDSWEQCKTHAESVDYLLGVAVQLRQMGIDPGQLPPSGTYRVVDSNSGNKKRKLSQDESDGFRGMSAVVNAQDCVSNPAPLMPRDKDHVSALLLDIEGCTTSIAFVKETLFPYVRTNLSQYLRSHEQPPSLRTGLLKEVQNVSPQFDATNATTEELILHLMDRDVKSATLKDLQGRMWEAGYQSGALKGHVYSDFHLMLEWMQQYEIPVYIYSSGSVKAQRLLFEHSIVGNLCPLLSGHYDIPTAGPKKEAASYKSIASALRMRPDEIVFCSDSSAELRAAHEAGVRHAIMTIRPGNEALGANRDEFPAIHSLLQLCGAE